MYVAYTGSDNTKGLRKGLVYEVKFSGGFEQLVVEAHLHREHIATLKYNNLTQFKHDWSDAVGK